MYKNIKDVAPLDEILVSSSNGFYLTSYQVRTVKEVTGHGFVLFISSVEEGDETKAYFPYGSTVQVKSTETVEATKQPINTEHDPFSFILNRDPVTRIDSLVAPVVKTNQVEAEHEEQSESSLGDDQSEFDKCENISRLISLAVYGVELEDENIELILKIANVMPPTYRRIRRNKLGQWCVSTANTITVIYFDSNLSICKPKETPEYYYRWI